MESAEVQDLVAQFRAKNKMVYCERRKLSMREDACREYQETYRHTCKIVMHKEQQHVHPRFTACRGCPHFLFDPTVPTNRGLLASNRLKRLPVDAEKRISKNLGAISLDKGRGESLTPHDEEELLYG